MPEHEPPVEEAYSIKEISSPDEFAEEAKKNHRSGLIRRFGRFINRHPFGASLILSAGLQIGTIHCETVAAISAVVRDATLALKHVIPSDERIAAKVNKFVRKQKCSPFKNEVRDRLEKSSLDQPIPFDWAQFLPQHEYCEGRISIAERDQLNQRVQKEQELVGSIARKNPDRVKAWEEILQNQPPYRKGRALLNDSMLKGGGNCNSHVRWGVTVFPPLYPDMTWRVQVMIKNWQFHARLIGLWQDRWWGFDEHIPYLLEPADFAGTVVRTTEDYLARPFVGAEPDGKTTGKTGKKDNPGEDPSAWSFASISTALRAAANTPATNGLPSGVQLVAITQNHQIPQHRSSLNFGGEQSERPAGIIPSGARPEHKESNVRIIELIAFSMGDPSPAEQLARLRDPYDITWKAGQLRGRRFTYVESFENEEREKKDGVTVAQGKKGWALITRSGRVLKKNLFLKPKYIGNGQWLIATLNRNNPQATPQKWIVDDQGNHSDIPGGYNIREPADEGMSIWKRENDGKFVYRNAKGEFIGEGFEEAFPFSENRAVVKHNGSYGFIDQTGKIIICGYSSKGSYQFDNGIVAMKDPRGSHLINAAGNVIAKLPFFIESLSYTGDSNWVAQYRNRDDKRDSREYAYRIISRDGKISREFLSVSPNFVSGVGTATIQTGKKNRSAFVQSNGDQISPEFDQTSVLEDGKKIIGQRLPDGRMVEYMINDDYQIISPSYDKILSWSENKGVVKKGDAYYFINERTYTIISPPYTHAWPFKRSRAIVEREDGQWLIKEEGGIFQDVVGPFQRIIEGRGLWLVKMFKENFYQIDKDGNRIFAEEDRN